MKYVFNRNGKDIKRWANINRELENTLEEIKNGKVQESELKIYLIKAVHDANVREEEKMAFWEYDSSDSMPSDARCEFVYKPTYLMTLIMVNIVSQYPEIMNLSGVEETLRYALNACTGCDLRGHGYESYDVLCENVLLFMKSGIVEFMKAWPLFSIRFESAFRNALNEIEKNNRAGNNTDFAWDANCKEIQDEIVRLRCEGNLRPSTLS